ncbi:MAG TPA: putative sugar nucleotidyl transferase [Chitinophagaceae bacterium]|nr:putative sugar nucleotidyl transferase [Chitinophagaceae bacterium]
MQAANNPESLNDRLYPLCEMRDCTDLRVGILSIREKWERIMGAAALVSGQEITILHENERLVLPGNSLPDHDFALRWEQAGCPMDSSHAVFRSLPQIMYPWEIVQLNDRAIREDFELLTRDRKSMPLPATVQVVAPEWVFLEEGAELNFVTINARSGPVYIGKNVQIMEGCLIRGPVSIADNSVLKMGTRIYGASSIGPNCTIGGELKNVVLLGNSNKAHDGYLGDSVIAEWCNLGAGCSNSNVKNSAGPVRVWNPKLEAYSNAGFKSGLLMGDYSRAAINTAFNTGTVVGICANVFGSGLTPAFIPDFSWGSSGDVKYEFSKALRDIANWKKLKNKALDEAEIQRLKSIFER